MNEFTYIVGIDHTNTVVMTLIHPVDVHLLRESKDSISETVSEVNGNANNDLEDRMPRGRSNEECDERNGKGGLHDGGCG